ncbi:MAG: hypothetical protein AB7N80_13115 [Bdellovibrionales bacterium]
MALRSALKQMRTVRIESALSIAGLTLLLGLFQNCAPFESTLTSKLDTFDAASYQALEDDVATVFSNRCVGCHSSLVVGSNEPYLNLVYELKQAQIYVRRGDPMNSILYQSLLSGAMPEGGPNLTTAAPAEMDAIRDWIILMPAL